MQLFISRSPSAQQSLIHITEERIVHQCHTVLRMKPNDQFFLQDQEGTQRHRILITNINKKEIIGHISHTDRPSSSKTCNINSIICIAIPNRIDKAELIVQKLTEIGISQIIFFRSSRSIIHEIKDKTLCRLQTIALEATEQSFGRNLPIIQFQKSLDSLLQKNILNADLSIQHILLDHEGTDRENFNKSTKATKDITYAYIGPEGGFTIQEKDQVRSLKNSESLTLGTTNLRMETAAIITGRLLQNR